MDHSTPSPDVPLRYCVRVDVDGFLHDADPIPCRDIEDARAVLISEIRRTAASVPVAARHEAALEQAAAVPETGGVIHLGDYAHELSPAENVLP